MFYFDFEKPIKELEEKIEIISSHPEKSDQLIDLVKELETLKKEVYTKLSGWNKVQLSRHPERPFTLDYIKNITTGFEELHGDRKAGDDLAIVGGFAMIDKQTVMFIGHQKGRNMKENQMRNFGMANPEGYRKALRLMKLAEKFNKPVVTFIDTPGASPGMEAEDRGQAEAIATNLQEMITLKVPIINIIIGEGAAAGALGIGLGDLMIMLENTWFSVISPESCSSILWHNWDHKEESAEQMKLTARDLCKFKLIDGIIEETQGGAHHDPQFTFTKVKKEILKHLKVLIKMSPEDRIEKRIKKYSSMGIFSEKENS